MVDFREDEEIGGGRRGGEEEEEEGEEEKKKEEIREKGWKRGFICFIEVFGYLFNIIIYG